MRAILLRMSAKRRADLSEGTHGLLLDGTPEPLRADRLGYDIDWATEDFADASGQRIKATEIRKAPGCGFGAQADSHIHVRTLGLIASRDRPNE